jgi:hypothetical protein
MIGLTIQEIKNELLANNQDIVDLSDNEVFLKFDEFVKQNSKKIKIKNMKQYVGQTVGINTPDGFVVAIGLLRWGAMLDTHPQSRVSPISKANSLFQKMGKVKEWLMP